MTQHIRMTKSQIERTSPDKNLIRITEKIINQNELILKMNSDLLKTIASPVFICNTEDEGHTETHET